MEENKAGPVCRAEQDANVLSLRSLPVARGVPDIQIQMTLGPGHGSAFYRFTGNAGTRSPQPWSSDSQASGQCRALALLFIVDHNDLVNSPFS